MNGWLLEDFPKTRAQAVLMARANIQPATVINLKQPLEEICKRTDKDVLALIAKQEAEAAALKAKDPEDEEPPAEEEEGVRRPNKLQPVTVSPDEMFS